MYSSTTFWIEQKFIWQRVDMILHKDFQLFSSFLLSFFHLRREPSQLVHFLAEELHEIFLYF